MSGDTACPPRMTLRPESCVQRRGLGCGHCVGTRLSSVTSRLWPPTVVLMPRPVSRREARNHPADFAPAASLGSERGGCCPRPACASGGSHGMPAPVAVAVRAEAPTARRSKFGRGHSPASPKTGPRSGSSRRILMPGCCQGLCRRRAVRRRPDDRQCDRPGRPGESGPVPRPRDFMGKTPDVPLTTPARRGDSAPPGPQARKYVVKRQRHGGFRDRRSLGAALAESRVIRADLVVVHECLAIS